MAGVCDYVVRNALIYDGNGDEPYLGDIGTKGSTISALGKVEGCGTLEINAEGLAAAPGFIDVHTHDDRLLLIEGAAAPKLSQGVTSVVTGNCGISLAPMTRDGLAVPPLTLLGASVNDFFPSFEAYRNALRTTLPSLNVVPLIGHTSLRASVMKQFDKPASRAELDAMGRLIDEAMTAGAFGLSSGLYYAPAFAADTQEMAWLLAKVSERGGIWTAHIRDEGDDLFASIDETLNIARAASVELVISHLKCASPAMWGKSAEALKRIEQAAQRQPVAFDVYPYGASSTMLRPDRLDDSRRIVVSWSDPHPETAGRDLADIAQCWCCTPQQAAARLTPGGAIYYKMQESDVKRIIAHPLAMIGSDGLPHDRHPHPRLWGTFPRVLGHYVRDLKILSLPEAVRKMTSLPAKVFGLEDRGRIALGMAADIVLFDPAEITDTATYELPVAPSRGIAHVFVNGSLAWTEGRSAGTKTGQILTRKAHQSVSPRPAGLPAPQ